VARKSHWKCHSGARTIKEGYIIMPKAIPKILQRILLVIGLLALLVLIIELGISIAATMHGNTPKRVIHTTAGPYALTVNLYDYPANAGFTLPFSIQAQPSQSLTYSVFSIPTGDIHATPVRASIGPDASHQGSIQGDAEITVQGPWALRITVNGPSGQGTVDVPIVATAPPAIPNWLGWFIGSIPLVILILFLVLQGRGRKNTPVVTTPTDEQSVESPNQQESSVP
jgi:hypothetical protein